MVGLAVARQGISAAEQSPTSCQWDTNGTHPFPRSLEGKGVRHVAQVQAPHVEDVLDGQRVSGIGAHPRPANGGERGDVVNTQGEQQRCMGCRLA